MFLTGARWDELDGASRLSRPCATDAHTYTLNFRFLLDTVYREKRRETMRDLQARWHM